MKNSIRSFATIAFALTTLISTKPSCAQTSSYFDQFSYKVLGDCAHVNELLFQELSSGVYADLGVDGQGRKRDGAVSLQLFTDGTYYATYDELVVTSHTDTITSFESEYSQILVGKWSVNEGQLVVEGFGVGTASFYQEITGEQRASVNFQVTQALHNPLILSHPTNLVIAQTNIGARGISINQFCGLHLN